MICYATSIISWLAVCTFLISICSHSKCVLLIRSSLFLQGSASLPPALLDINSFARNYVISILEAWYCHSQSFWLIPQSHLWSVPAFDVAFWPWRSLSLAIGVLPRYSTFAFSSHLSLLHRYPCVPTLFGCRSSSSFAFYWTFLPPPETPLRAVGSI